MDIKRLRELAGTNKKRLYAYHATDKRSAQSILSNGFQTRINTVWFNTSPNIGMDDGYIIKVVLKLENAWRGGEGGSERFDPDNIDDTRELIKRGYDSWVGESNVGEGDDVVVFHENQISDVEYYGKRVMDDDYNITYEK